MAAIASRAWSARRLRPLAKPRSPLAVVREVAQLELTGITDDVQPLGAAILPGGLFRMMLCHPQSGCVQIHPTVDRPFSEGLSQRTDNAGDRPMDLPIRRDAVDQKVMELWALHQFSKGCHALRHICGKRAQLFKLPIDLGASVPERILGLDAFIDSPDVVLLEEVVNERIPEVHQRAQIRLQGRMGFPWQIDPYVQAKKA